jgi:hypothetical protein
MVIRKASIRRNSTDTRIKINLYALGIPREASASINLSNIDTR